VLQLYVSLFGALEGGHACRHGQLVVVLPRRLQSFASGDGPGEDIGVQQCVPDVLGRGREVGGSGELHLEVLSASWLRPVPGAPRWVSRRAYSSEGDIGMAVMGKPSASSMADASAAETGITPASPAPLSPNGFIVEGVSWWSISIPSGTSVTY